MNDKPILIHPADGAVPAQCTGCRTPPGQFGKLRFAFQPIVDTGTGAAYAYEALVRGPNGEPAAAVLETVDEASRYHFDQRCRTSAIEQAAALNIDVHLSINFMPNAVYRPEACIRSTLEAAEKFQFPSDRIIFETVEGENILGRSHLVDIFRSYRSFGFQTAIDDFGAGFSGLKLLADFQPDLIKLDMDLVRGVDTNAARQSIVRGVVSMCRELDIRVIAEGVETLGERDFFTAHGVSLMQGYLFAKPAFHSTPEPGAEWLAGAARLS
ncbi:EAL domain-containing protein [Burkholderia glumae]|uniref:EAL domain-containing protein n=2 Tax=Burkholderia glumae TaxID=337 RepID=A0AAQ0BTH6_BURGL|nr:EAL domain-containing protein [Burkholderia glumae]ACR32423.1 Diguanylate phosphodiesterase [Burkholderia glumae BGR1]AJY63951.1 EAL domain protein [Burkholderia glumae LMG 2196 = ATCC 33617]MCM2484385.1 EAL domain-containing protein [Burkholderia glumae]MCM2510077.1 EAL domain-containing protein [Burkholderia glumae]MCM2539839.1 EAL domain-containing protein [Burkholderia glumae]